MKFIYVVAICVLCFEVGFESGRYNMVPKRDWVTLHSETWVKDGERRTMLDLCANYTNGNQSVVERDMVTISEK
jgi:hypothetical protein